MGSRGYYQLLAVVLVGLVSVGWSRIALCQTSDPAAEKQVKIRFMQAAIAAIDAVNRKSEKARKKAEQLTGRPLGKFPSLPRITPFGDWDYYYVENDLKWESRNGGKIKSVNVPKGFVTDLASVPKVFWVKFPPTGRYVYATIVHDYLYWTQERDRSEADAILKEALQDSRVDAATVLAFDVAVTTFGAQSWGANMKAKGAGEKRFLIKFPDDRLTSWEKWRKEPGVFRD